MKMIEVLAAHAAVDVLPPHMSVQCLCDLTYRSVTGHAYHVSSALRDAGCHEARTISTKEELDALSGWTVLRDDNEQLFEQNWMVATPDAMWWENLSEPGNMRQDPVLPATVLWEPLP